MIRPRRQRPAPFRYVIAVVLTLVAVAATQYLSALIAPMQLIFLWSAILVAAVYGGIGPALLSIAIALTGAVYTIFEPHGSFWISSPVDHVRLAIFAVFAIGIGGAVGMRRHVEQRNAELRDWFRTTLTSLAEGVIVTGAQGDVEFMNPVAESLLGWSWAEADGRDLADVLVVRPDPEARGEHEPAVLLVRRDGSSVAVEQTTTPLKNDSRETVGSVVVLRDITVRRDFERQRERLYHEAEQANRAKDEFLATLSHELRTPLTAIVGWASMLHARTLDVETTRLALDTILRTARSQGELIDDLLDLSRIVAGKLELALADVDFARIVDEVMASNRPAADARNLSMSFHPQERPMMLVADDRRLRQIVWNLLSNAVKFTEPGGRVAMTLTRSNSTIRFEVTDTGRGIESEFLPFVWDRFRQRDSSSTRQYGGLGLGLSLVRHIAEIHGGRVSASSDGLGQGSTFTVEMPVSMSAPAGRQSNAPARAPDPLEVPAASTEKSV